MNDSSVHLPARSRDERHQSDTKAKRRLLLVDDDGTVRRALIRMFRQDYDIHAVASAPEALELLASGQHIDLILCDLMMPDMGGVEFFEELRVQQPRMCTRTIFLSGGSVTRRSQEFVESPEVTVLLKPITRRELAAVVSSKLGSNATTE